MINQVKTFIVHNPEAVEDVMNEWLSKQGEIEICQLYPLGVLSSEAGSPAKPVLMFVLVYRKEGWR